jgi:hypothetical protein
MRLAAARHHGAPRATLGSASARESIDGPRAPTPQGQAFERIDRQEKLLAYQTLPSLQEYLLVAQDDRDVAVYSRRTDWPAEH